MASPLFTSDPNVEVRIRDGGALPPQTVCEAFLATAARCGEKPALQGCSKAGADPLLNPPEKYSWAEYKKASFDFAKGLLAAGLKPKGRVRNAHLLVYTRPMHVRFSPCHEPRIRCELDVNQVWMLVGNGSGQWDRFQCRDRSTVAVSRPL